MDAKQVLTEIIKFIENLHHNREYFTAENTVGYTVARLDFSEFVLNLNKSVVGEKP